MNIGDHRFDPSHFGVHRREVQRRLPAAGGGTADGQPLPKTQSLYLDFVNLRDVTAATRRELLQVPTALTIGDPEVTSFTPVARCCARRSRSRRSRAHSVSSLS